MSTRRRSPFGRPPRSRTLGQAIVEFALVVPVLAALLLGIADFARWYTTAVAIEAAAREAADFGAFSVANWADSTSTDATATEMRRRACTAASSLTGYLEPPGTIGHADCTNPVFSYRLLPADTTTCGNPATDPPCRVDVTLTYQFNLFFGVPPFPSSITFSRESIYAISALPGASVSPAPSSSAAPSASAP